MEKSVYDHVAFSAVDDFCRRECMEFERQKDYLVNHGINDVDATIACLAELAYRMLIIDLDEVFCLISEETWHLLDLYHAENLASVFKKE